MDEMPSTTSSEPISPTAGPSSWIWLVAGIVMTTAAALAAAHSPPRIRLIGLFSVAFGLVVGWLLARLVETLDCHPSRRAIRIAAAVFTLCGLIGSTCETVRLNEAQKPKSGTDAIAARIIEQIKMQSSTGESDGGISSMTPKESSSLAMIRRYLSRRLQPLGEWRSPWPETFWCLELCTAAAASVWISTRKQKP